MARRNQAAARAALDELRGRINRLRNYIEARAYRAGLHADAGECLDWVGLSAELSARLAQHPAGLKQATEQQRIEFHLLRALDGLTVAEESAHDVHAARAAHAVMDVFGSLLTVSEEEAERRQLHDAATYKSRKGGQAPKRLELIWQRVCYVVKAKPLATAEDVFRSIPDAREVANESGALVYRDGAKLVQVDDRTGREKSLVKRSLERYVSDAKRLRPQ